MSSRTEKIPTPNRSMRFANSTDSSPFFRPAWPALVFLLFYHIPPPIPRGCTKNRALHQVKTGPAAGKARSRSGFCCFLPCAGRRIKKQQDIERKHKLINQICRLRRQQRERKERKIYGPTDPTVSFHPSRLLSIIAHPYDQFQHPPIQIVCRECLQIFRKAANFS